VTDSHRGELLTTLLLELGTYGTSEDPVQALRELKRRERALREVCLEIQKEHASCDDGCSEAPGFLARVDAALAGGGNE
jgi:hypothetical protein